MELFHDTACPCAYCDLERTERAEATIHRAILLARIGMVALVLLLPLLLWLFS